MADPIPIQHVIDSVARLITIGQALATTISLGESDSQEHLPVAIREELSPFLQLLAKLQQQLQVEIERPLCLAKFFVTVAAQIKTCETLFEELSDLKRYQKSSPAESCLPRLLQLKYDFFVSWSIIIHRHFSENAQREDDMRNVKHGIAIRDFNIQREVLALEAEKKRMELTRDVTPSSLDSSWLYSNGSLEGPNLHNPPAELYNETTSPPSLPLNGSAICEKAQGEARSPSRATTIVNDTYAETKSLGKYQSSYMPYLVLSATKTRKFPWLREKWDVNVVPMTEDGVKHCLQKRSAIDYDGVWNKYRRLPLKCRKAIYRWIQLEMIATHDMVFNGLINVSIHPSSRVPTKLMDNVQVVFCRDGAPPPYQKTKNRPKPVTDAIIPIVDPIPAQTNDDDKWITFTDCVQRKFIWPWSQVKTFVGLHSLLVEAFTCVEMLEGHVRDGHFDLVGDNDNIILPTIWHLSVKPGDTIRMQMWRLAEPLLPPPPPVPAPYIPTPYVRESYVPEPYTPFRAREVRRQSSFSTEDEVDSAFPPFELIDLDGPAVEAPDQPVVTEYEAPDDPTNELHGHSSPDTADEPLPPLPRPLPPYQAPMFSYAATSDDGGIPADSECIEVFDMMFPPVIPPSTSGRASGSFNPFASLVELMDQYTVQTPALRRYPRNPF